MKDVVYRVVQIGDETEYRQSGYRNATGLYNTIGGARGQVGRERKDARNRNANRQAWAQRKGEDFVPTPVPQFKIQRSVLSWEDVE